jgi:hypothetical protein
MNNIFTFIVLLSVSTSSIAKDKITFSSGEKQTTMIELYTSEGCSSCPPADRWLSHWKKDPTLWNDVIPMAFHVDYWDYIGWNDVFADSKYSQRQRTHRVQNNIKSVYTPGFVINGKEWKGFFNFLHKEVPTTSSNPGVLKASVDNGVASIEFLSTNNPLQYHMAVLGLGLTTKVQRGENAGKTLNHDFVVLHHQSETGNQSASMRLPKDLKPAKEYALAVWVSPIGSLKPIQATGGVLSNF